MPPTRARPSLPSSMPRRDSSPLRRSPRQAEARRKRAQSMGSEAASTSLSPTRRERTAVRPRKSAIRATPQVFQSPTSLGPNPEHAHIRTSNNSSDIATLVESTARESLDELVDERLQSPGLPNPFASLYRAASASPVKQEAHTVMIVPPATEAQAERKRRRVTFSAFEEQTAFEQDEPTMSIRPAQERNALMERGSPVPNPSHEWDESTSTIASSDMSMDMSLDTSVMDMTEAWHPVDDAESSTTVDRESSMLAEEDSYTRDMEMTQAMAPVSTEQDTTTTMEFTSVHSALPGEDDLSMNTTMDSEAEQSAMEMTEMWGRIADEAQRRDAAAEEEVEALVGQESPRITASPSKPSQRSPERRQTMVLSPERSGRSVASSRTSTPKAPIAITPRPSTPPPAATDEAVALAPASPFSPVKAGPTTPTRFRQSLRGGVPSPEYQHSPARRALTTPPVGTVKPFATARAATPSSQTRAAHARLSEAHTPMYPRSPFIHSLIRQRGVRLSSTAPASPHVDTDDVSLSETSFHMHLADFLGVIGLKFHEDMTASRTKADRPLEPTPATTPVEHAKMAGAAVPMLQALRSACADLKQHVEDGRKRLKTMEENFYVRPPAFVQEWGQLDDEDMRRSMKGQLNVHKQAARAAAMHDYYGWRTDMEFDEEMTALLQKHRDLLQADRATLEAKEAQLTKTLLPALRARYADLHARVQEAWKRQEAIRQCDPEELKQLHASIDEQDQVLQTMRAKQHDLQDQLSRVQARVEETAAKREQTEEMIRAARAVTDQIQGCTPGEAVRLERHVRHLETLMQWSLTNKTSTLLQLTFARTWQVTIELDSRRGAVKRVAIAPATPIDVSHPHAVALAVIRAAMEAHTPTHVSDVLRAVARHWHAYQHICAEIAHVQTWVPVTMMPHQDQETALDILASVLLEKAQAKVQVRMVMDLAADDPLAARGLHMELVYGHVDTHAMTQLARRALTKAHGTYGALAQAIQHACVAMES